MAQLPTVAEVLAEVEPSLERWGRVALCSVLRAEGSTPGRPGWRLLLRPDGSTFGNLGGGAFEGMVIHDARARLAGGSAAPEVKRYYLTEKASRGEATGMVCGGFLEVAIERLEARPVLVICGGGPVGQALAANAALCDFELAVVEDREEFLGAELFPPRTRLIRTDREYSSEFLAGLEHRELWITVVTRCWETDTAALAGVLRQQPEHLSYLGLMGSERKVRRVREELAARDLELAEEELDAPIGIEVGAETPAELAVSILAGLLRHRSERVAIPVRKLRDAAQA